MSQERAHGYIRPLHTEMQGIKRAADTCLIFITYYVSLKHYGVHQSDYYLLFIFTTILYGVVAEHRGIYQTWRGAPLFDHALDIIVIWLISFTTVASSLYLFDFIIFPQEPELAEKTKQALALWMPLAPLAIILLHCSRRGILSYLRTKDVNTRSYAILGANLLGQRLNHNINRMPWLGYKFMGFFDDRTNKKNPRLPDEIIDRVDGNFKELLEKAQRGKIDHVYITLPLRAEKRIEKLVQDLADSTASVNIVPDFFTFSLLHSKVTNINGIPVVSVYDTPLNSDLDGFIKRIEDLVLCAFILPLIALPMLIIAIAIKISSPGPIIFKQYRYGVNGEQIRVWKFRSMSVCENGDTIKQATANDSRVTPLGAFLRRTSLDELPQFINVLQGSMSVVGPRPHAVAHNEYYRKEIKLYMLRHKMKPGITGLAQINGCRGETNTIDKMEARINYDLEYIRNWSVFQDVKIVFMTVFKGFVGSQAY